MQSQERMKSNLTLYCLLSLSDTESGNNPIPESELEMLLIKLVNRKMLAFGTLKGVTFLFEMRSHGQVHVSYE